MKGRQSVLLAGDWRELRAAPSWFAAADPRTGQSLPDHYPVCGWPDAERAVQAGRIAVEELRSVAVERIAEFLESYAAAIEARASQLVDLAHEESGLPEPGAFELPRTTAQLREAAAAARDRSWRCAVIDTQRNVRTLLGPLLGPVVVMAPPGSPLSRNAVAGADFAAAIAAGNPVIARASPCHPGTTRLLAELAFETLQRQRLPLAMMQMVYDLQAEDAMRLAAHRGVGAIAYCGGRENGLGLKGVADAVGVPIHVELPSADPAFVLPGALLERNDEIAGELGSSMLEAWQSRGNLQIVVLLFDHASESLARKLQQRFEAAAPGLCASQAALKQHLQGLDTLQGAGASLVAGGNATGTGFHVEPTLLRVAGSAFLEKPDALQIELGSAATLLVFAASEEQMLQIAAALYGSLAMSVFSSRGVADEALYGRLVPLLRERCGRLLNERLADDQASPAMVRGGPWPATGHAGFGAGGVAFAMQRFALLHCFDQVRKKRLPLELRDKNPSGTMWRLVDGEWTQRDL